MAVRSGREKDSGVLCVRVIVCVIVCVCVCVWGGQGRKGKKWEQNNNNKTPHKPQITGRVTE